MKYLILYITLITSLTASADTVLNSPDFFQDTLLTKAKSPYVIRGSTFVHPDVTVTVEKGSKIIFENGNIFVRQRGHLIIKGDVGEEIEIEVKGDSSRKLISGDKAEIQLSFLRLKNVRSLVEAWNHSVVYVGNMVQDQYSGGGTFISIFDHSFAIVNHVTISHLRQGSAIEVFTNSELTVMDSLFEGNKEAIRVFGNVTTTIQTSEFYDNERAIYAFNTDATIHQNDFENNDLSLYTHGGDGLAHIIDARDNWWGDATGPGSTIDDFEGIATLAPWSIEKSKKKLPGKCCSNALFIPGLMGSRLYANGGVLENQLWEPNRNADIKSLFLNDQGKSILPSIYTRDIIQKTNIAGGLPGVDQDIYGSFAIYMNSLVKQKVFTSWEAVPYDWRFAPDSILTDGILTGTKKNQKQASLVDTVTRLAGTSETKKVTIVTHSNGGLVAKQLMMTLREKGLDGLVDKIVFVAMPEFGSPQAVTGLLFGHNQEIGGGVILKASVAMQLGKNMPASYLLLPSEAYFSETTLTLSFKGTNVTGVGDLKQMMLASGNVNETLFDRADTLHQTLDSWAPKPSLRIFQIVGTGVATVSGLAGVEGKEGSQTAIPEYSTEGDGVVLVGTGRIGRVSSIDLKDSKYAHANIMNESKVQLAIGNILRATSTSGDIATGLDPVQVAGMSAEYRLVKISPASTDLPGDLELHTAHERLATAPAGSLDTVSADSNAGRFELFGGQAYHISTERRDPVVISANRSADMRVEVFEKSAAGLTQLIFPMLYAQPGAEMTVSPDDSLTINIPLVDQSIDILPEKKIVFDQSGTMTSQETTTTSTETVEQRIARIRTSITASNVTTYLKVRYLRMLDIYAASRKPADAKAIQTRIERSIAGINVFSKSPFIFARYRKLRQDYVYMSYLFAGL